MYFFSVKKSERQKNAKKTKKGEKRVPKGRGLAIKPDLAGERKAPCNLLLQCCYLPLSVETDLTTLLSAVICCSSVCCYCLLLFTAACCCYLLLCTAILQLFTSVRYDFLPFILSSSSLLFAAMRVAFSKTCCSHLLPFGVICCS